MTVASTHPLENVWLQGQSQDREGGWGRERGPGFECYKDFAASVGKDSKMSSDCQSADMTDVSGRDVTEWKLPTSQPPPRADPKLQPETPAGPMSLTKTSQMNTELNLKMEVWLWKFASQTILLIPSPHSMKLSRFQTDRCSQDIIYTKKMVVTALYMITPLNFPENPQKFTSFHVLEKLYVFKFKSILNIVLIILNL